MEIKNIKVNEYYFHSIIHGAQNTLKTLDGIFSSGSISSPKYRNINKRFGCNSLDEVCLSSQRKVSNVNLYKSCFDLYLNELVTLIIDKSIKKNARIYQPKLVTTDEIFLMFNTEGYTNLYDEYRTKDIITTDYIKGISIPYEALATDPFLFVKLLDEEMRNYLGGLVQVMFITVFEYGIAYMIIGHPNAIMLGIMAGIATLIPYFGGIIVNIVAAITAFIISPALFVRTCITFFLLSSLDSYVINPHVYGKTNKMHPLLTIFALFAGGAIFGLFGVLISFPLAIFLVSLFKFYKDDISESFEKIKENKKKGAEA